MKAAVVTRYGPPGVLSLREVPRPQPGPGEVLVRVRAIGLNFADIIGRWGVYPGTPRPPFIPGIEFSGEVAELGSGVGTLQEGDRVMGYSRQGSHAEFVPVDQRFVARVPDFATFEQAAAFSVTSMTAYHGLVTLAGVRQGERILIHSAGGGVGTAAIQLGKHLGTEVFGTVGSKRKFPVAKDQGADHVFNYRSENFEQRIRDETSGYGVDVVMDAVGGPVFRKSWNLLSGMGRYILYGLSSVSGEKGLNLLKVLRTYALMGIILPPALISVNKSIAGFNLGTLVGKEDYFMDTSSKVLELFAKKIFNPVIGKMFPFEEIVAAHRFLQTGKSVGKIIVVL